MLFLNTERVFIGNVQVQGYFQSKRSGVSAYLNAPAATNVLIAGNFYPIAGAFTNSPLDDMILDVDKIKYTGDKPFPFEIDWHASLTGSSPNTSVTIAVKRNTTVSTAQAMTAYCKNAGEAYSLSGTLVCDLSPGDTIQLVLTADVVGNVTVNHFTTTMRRFYS